MTVIKATKNVSKKDLINARASAPLKNLNDFTALNAVAICEDVDGETGEARNYVYLFTTIGVYAGSSSAIIDSAEDIIDMIDDGEMISVKVTTRQSKSGRDFNVLEVV